MDQQQQQALVNFIERCAKKGCTGLRLLVRVGSAGLQQVDEYALDGHAAGQVLTDASINAEGFEESASFFVLQAFLDGQEKPAASHSFAIRRAPGLDTPDRYDPEDRAQLRLAYEQLDKSHKVIAHMVPATIGAAIGPLAEMIRVMTGHFQQMSTAQQEELRELRRIRESADRAATIQAEREMLRDVTREERMGKLIDMGLNMAPQLLEAVTTKGGA